VTVILAHLHLKVQQLSRGGGQEIAGGNGSRGIDFKWFQLMIFHGRHNNASSAAAVAAVLGILLQQGGINALVGAAVGGK